MPRLFLPLADDAPGGDRCLDDNNDALGDDVRAFELGGGDGAVRLLDDGRHGAPQPDGDERGDAIPGVRRMKTEISAAGLIRPQLTSGPT